MANKATTAVWPSPAMLTLPDGKIHVEMVGGKSYIVTKNAGQLSLWIVANHEQRTNFVQTQLNMADPYNLSLPYMQAMSLGLLWANPPARICLLGLGGGAMARTFHHYFPTVPIDCVDISPTVARLAEQFFGLASDEQLRIFVSDARSHLANSEQTYDLILVDVFTDKGRIPQHLGTKQFFALCKSRLTPEGVVAMNISSQAPDHLSKAHTFAASYAHLSQLTVSPHTTIWFGSQTKGWMNSSFKRKAHRLQRQYRLTFPFAAWSEQMEAIASVDELPAELSSAAILSDDFQPGEREDASQ